MSHLFVMNLTLSFSYSVPVVVPTRTGSSVRRQSTTTTTTTTEVPITTDQNVVESEADQPEVSSSPSPPLATQSRPPQSPAALPRNVSIHFDENVNVFAYQDAESSARAPSKQKMFYMAEMQRLDGWYNNLAHPRWGSMENHLTRKVPPSYSDGVYMMAGADRPSPRALSQALMKGEDGKSSAHNLTVLFTFFGKFNIIHGFLFFFIIIP